jgi:hydrogenase maturation protease
VVVVGIGNLLLKDEGIGVHVAHALEHAPSPSDVELQVIDGGISPHLLPLFEGVDKLIILDAAKGGGEPGAIYRFAPEAVNIEERAITSVHQIGLLETLRLMKSLGKQPKRIVIIGIEPKEIDYGLELSPELERRIPDITAIVLKEIAEPIHS